MSLQPLAQAHHFARQPEAPRLQILRTIGIPHAQTRRKLHAEG
jgi:hypothetical protein